MTGHTPEIKGVITYVLREPDEILFLLRQGGPYHGGWWPVAGRPEAGESPLETARRELLEETGLTTTQFYRFGMTIPHADGVSVLAAYVTFVSGNPAITLNHEHSDWRWQTPEQTLMGVPATSRHIIQHLIDTFLLQPPPAALKQKE